jgi:hypothetical protein
VLEVGERLFLELDRCFLPEDRVPKGGARIHAPRGAGAKGESPAVIERLPSIEALRSSRFGRLCEGVAMPPSAWIVLEVAPARGFFDRFLGAHRFLVMGFDTDVPVLGELAFPSRVGIPFSAPDVRPIPVRLYCQTPVGSAVALPGGPWPAREDFETGRRDRLSAARTGDIASEDLDIHRAQIPAGRANEVIRVRIQISSSA